MKNFFVAFVLVSFLSFLSINITTFSGIVYAADTVDPFSYTCDPDGAGTDFDGNTTAFCDNVSDEKSRSIVYGEKSLLYKIAQTIAYLVGVISVIMLIIGGFRYVVSGGDSNAISGAKNTIIYALVGVAVAVFAQMLVTLVLSRFI